MRNYITVLVLFLSHFSFGQNCELVLTGIINDHFGHPLEFTNILIEETGQGAVADSVGNFRIPKLCAGAYHLRVSHVSCETVRMFVSVQNDTTIAIEMEHHSEFLQSVIVEGHEEEASAQTQQSISGAELTKEGGKALGEILQNITGVSSLKNGSGISKPVIHGLFGNRISVLNNGIVQAGQQWGNDHAPEIDPFSANQIAVLKGVDAIPYGGNGLGGLVLVEPGFIPSDPHLHGSVNYGFHSNGLLHVASAKLAKSSPWFKWRATGTFKYGGDQQTPGYFLNNTGVREQNFSLQLNKNIDDKWFNDLYYSYFSTELGILRGSHIGNQTDLAQAIGREIPFFTEDEFSYELEAPKQQVNHHLIKLSSKYYLNKKESLHLTYGGQLNRRKEFDVRRSGRSEIAALDLRLQSHFFDLHYANTYDGDKKWKAGLQYKFNENDNQPGTGILPLLPDYRLNNISAFTTYNLIGPIWTFDFGGRYDFIQLNVANISNDLPRRIERHEHQFHNYSLALGTQFKPSSSFTSKLNLGLTQRSPEVNELYSSGLHQGVSGIEEGDSTLQQEQAVKVILTNTISTGHHFIIEISGYYQYISDYIYLNPNDEFRLTIRGAFPVFTYEQTDASIAGLDAMAKFEPTERLELLLKYAIVRGRDLGNDLPLIYMPADNAYGSVTYAAPDWGKLKEPSLTLSGRYVFQQTRLEPEQDFLAPPDAYFLLGLGLDTKIQFSKTTLNLTLQVDNLLNEQYRDYLNRLRYYADEAGRNIRLNLRYEF